MLQQELARNGAVVVHRKVGMSYADFERDHLMPGIPVVIGDATQSWPALQRFSPDFFERHYGDRPVRMSRGNFKDEFVPLSYFIELMRRSTADDPAPYPCKLVIEDDIQELFADIEPRFSYSLPNRIGHRLLPPQLLGAAHTAEVFFGSPGGEFPCLHVDYMGLHAFICEIYGRKEFTVIPPAQTDCVYPDPDNPWMSSMQGHHRPDLERYPRYAQATPVSFSIGPGDTLFIPNGWWHTARSLEMTISVALDTLNASNWSRFVSEAVRMYDRPWKQATVRAALAVVHRLISLGERRPRSGPQVTAGDARRAPGSASVLTAESTVPAALRTDRPAV
jgi:hypothetical protein